MNIEHKPKIKSALIAELRETAEALYAVGDNPLEGVALHMLLDWYEGKSVDPHNLKHIERVK